MKRTTEGYETKEAAPEAATTMTEEETVDVFSWDGQTRHTHDSRKRATHANPSQITPNPDDREALERSELVQQNGCRQRLESYLSCQQRLALAVA